MAKQISISISDEMHAQLQELKDDMTGAGGKRKISTICQNALKEALTEAKSSRAYRLDGIKDGQKVALILSREDKQFVAKFFNKTGPYKFWSKEKKIEELKTYFEDKKKIDIDILYPQFIAIMDGLHTLHDWVTNKNDLIAQDRRGEMAWSYIQGCYEGIYATYLKEEAKE